MDMLARAKRLLAEPTGYVPGDAVPTTIVPARPRLFVVTDAMKLDPSDISGNIANAVKENTAMTTTETTLVDQMISNLKLASDEIENRKSLVLDEQAKEKSEHDAEIARLNDEIASRNSVHEDAIKSFEARLKDADDAMNAVKAAMNALPSVPTVAPVPVAPTK